jgi:hypothetical protein
VIDDHRDVLRSRVGGALHSAFLALSGVDAFKLLLVARFGKTRRPGRMTFEAVLIPNLPADVPKQKISGYFRIQIGEHVMGTGRRIYPSATTATIHRRRPPCELKARNATPLRHALGPPITLPPAIPTFSAGSRPRRLSFV